MTVYTVRTYLPIVMASTTPEARAVYQPYWDMLIERIGDKMVADVNATDIRMASLAARYKAVQRRNSVGGTSAQEHMITACRKFFALAHEDRLTPVNYAMRIEKPRRAPSSRHALIPEQVAEVYGAVSETETHLIRFLMETGCRREGLLNLSPDKLRAERQCVILDEKGSLKREQPISPELAALLLDPDTPLYYWTRRRLDSLWIRVRKELQWADDVGLSTHWFRHTFASWLEQSGAPYPTVAAACGHVAAGTTATYIHVTIHDVARAVSRLYGYSHPLAS